MARIFIVEQNALGVGGHYFAYTGCVARAAITAGLEPVILQNTRQKTDWAIPGATVISAFTRNWGEAERAGNTGWGPGDIVYELLAATSSAPPAAGDHVLFHTLGQTELRSVLSYLAKIPPSDHIPIFHVLLRYDPIDLGPTILALEPVLTHIRNARHLRGAVRFHTDTDRLTSVYTRMTRLPFSTLPIPFAQAELRKLLAETPERAADAPITFVYLGDARIEKNFHHIPAAIGLLWERYVRPGKVRFILQSNFNTEGGETGQLAAVQRLGQLPSDRVRLISAPMEQADYYATLNQADVVLVPYCARRYRERSSGVLVEAMAAGKPVITSSGSWMESFVTADHAVLFDDPVDLAAAMEKIIVDFDRYRAGALAIRDRMLDWSSGDNFVRALQAKDIPPVLDDRPNALVIMNGDAMVLQNGSSQIARSQFEYFSAAGFRVTGLFLTRERRASNEEIEAFTEALLGATGGMPMDECHVAAPGRLAADILAQSMARSREEESIGAELDLVSYFDFSSTTLRALRRHRPDIILLNYITNIGVIDALGLEDVPLVCEMLDIQSFQKAIYGRRAVSADDLELELAMLGRCDYLISLNDAETQFIEDRLPGVPCRTSGIFSSAKPSTYADLAGCKEVAELISSTGPRLRSLRYDDSWHSEDLDALRHRLAFPRVDILFVSSSHLANVSGLRWFLDEVYGPYLAPVGVRMIVAGSVSDYGNWPKFDGLLFTGQVEDLTPLYAAARVVVLPITEGAGSAVKAFEAMRYIRPIVATPIALRGIQEQIDGIFVASEPADFAEQVLRLVRSPELRAQCRAKIAAATEKLIDPARYRAVMNEAVAHVLGPTAPRAPIGITTSLRPTDVEWDAETIALNRLIRNLLDDEELDWANLRLLAAIDRDHLQVRVTETVNALLIEQSAPLLRSEARVRNRLQAMYTRFPDFAGQVAPLLFQAIAYAEARTAHSDARSAGAPSGFQLVHHHDHAVSLITLDKGGTIDVALDGLQIEPSLVQRHDDWRIATFGVSALPEASYYFATRDVRLQTSETTPAVVITDTVRVSERLETLGTPLIADQAKSSLLFLSADRSRILNLPRLGGLPNGILVVDIFFTDDFGVDATLAVSQSGIDVSPGIAVAEGRPVRRIQMDNLRERSPFGLIPLSLRVADTLEDGKGVAVEKVRLSLVSGIDPDEALAVLENVAAPTFELATDGTLPTAVASRLRELLIQAAAGRPIALNSTHILRETARSTKGQDALYAAARTLFRTSGQPEDGHLDRIIDTILFPERTATRAGAMAFVAAPGIDVTCRASFAGSDRGIFCRIGGVTLTDRHRGPDGVMRWHGTSGSQGSGLWMHEVEWRDADGRVVTVDATRVVIAFPASLGTATGDERVVATNLYALETDGDGQQFRWTGPGTTTSFLLPLAVTAPGEFRMTLMSLGKNEPADIAVFVNGKPAPTTIDRGDDDTPPMIRAMLRPQDGAATTLIEVVHRQLFFPSSADPRRLAIGFMRIEVELELSVAPDDADATQQVLERSR